MILHRWTRRSLLFLTGVATVPALSSCTAANPAGYTDESKTIIRSLCDSGDEKTCECTIRLLEDNVPFEEFRRNFNMGDRGLLIDAMSRCSMNPDMDKE